jgi:hypothetical protein
MHCCEVVGDLPRTRNVWGLRGLAIFIEVMQMEEIAEKIGSLEDYRDALPEDDQRAFDSLMKFARARVSACARASKLTVLESMLLAMVIEQQKLIERGPC